MCTSKFFFFFFFFFFYFFFLWLVCMFDCLYSIVQMLHGSSFFFLCYKYSFYPIGSTPFYSLKNNND
ncbi:hypothetical protein J3Q64DRAFT_1753694, partial [Phycomyces blakesleeanus]